MSENRNSGVHLLNFPHETAQQNEFTVIVSGLGRSGTTMIATMLRAGGVFMGVPKDSVIHEDVHIANLIETRQEEQLSKFINNRNMRWKIWGFKRPLIVSHSDFYEQWVRSPRYIIIYRDPLAVSMRNMKSMRYPFQAAMDTYFSQMQDIQHFVRKNKFPILFLSYEKALLDKRFVAKNVARFCGIHQAMIPKMVESINPNDPRYLEGTKAPPKSE